MLPSIYVTQYSPSFALYRMLRTPLRNLSCFRLFAWLVDCLNYPNYRLSYTLRTNVVMKKFSLEMDSTPDFKLSPCSECCMLSSG